MANIKTNSNINNTALPRSITLTDSAVARVGYLLDAEKENTKNKNNKTDLIYLLIPLFPEYC